MPSHQHIRPAANKQDQADMENAHALVEMGVPIFVCKLKTNGDPIPPLGWERITPSHARVDRWLPRSNMALCAITGHVFDVIDIDPRNGGTLSHKRLARELGEDGPEIYWEVDTASGGKHLYIATLGLGTRPGFLPGIDLKGGMADGSSRGFVFLPPTVRPSKAEANTGERVPYRPRTALAGINGQDPCLGALKAFIQRPAMAGAFVGHPREQISALKQACIAAPAGGQRTALLRYTYELERKGYERADILILLAALVKEMPCYDQRKPWRAGDLRGLLHKPGEVTPDGTDDELADLAPRSRAMRDEEEFWESRHELRVIRQMARSRMIGPQALLGAVLARVLAEIPHNVVLPAIVGARGTLNILIALTGSSGEGKTTAESSADELLSVVRQPGAEVPARRNAGSGQGITGVYGQNVMDKATGKYSLHRSAYSAIFSIGEISTLGAHAAQAGSTILPTLQEAYSGQALGAAYSDAHKNRTIPEHSYRFCAVAQVQGELSSLILDYAASGFAGRWVWFSTDDHPVTMVEPEPLSWQVPDLAGLDDDVVELAVCAEAREDVLAHRKERRSRSASGEAVDPLEAHMMLTRLKVAAALALLHGNGGVLASDWELSGAVMAMSDACRQRAQEAQDRVNAEADKASGARAGVKAAAARQKQSEVAFAERREAIASRIIELADSTGMVSRSDLRRKYARQREQFDKDIEAMVKDGSVIKVEDAYQNQLRVRYSVPGNAISKRGTGRKK